MRFRTKRRIFRLTLVGILALGLIGLISWGIYRLSNPTLPLNKRTAPLPADSARAVTGWEDGFLCVQGTTLLCVDTAGSQIWSADLPTTGMQASRAFGLTAAWRDNTLLLFDERGTLLLTKEMDSPILSLACGGSSVALLVRAEDQYRVWVVNTQGSIVDELRYPYQAVVSMAFYGNGGKQLWVLTLDSHGTQPKAVCRSYYPGESMTGAVTLNNQVAVTALPTEKTTYVLGTHNLIGQSHTGGEKYDKLVYGWSLQDCRADSTGVTRFLLAPSNTGEQDAPLSMLWMIAPGQKEYRISLPTGCFRAFLADSGIVTVTQQGVYHMGLDGSHRSFSKMPFLIDGVTAVSPGKAIVVESAGLPYLIPLV